MTAESRQDASVEDPLRFVLAALEAEGALVERSGDRATALLPPPLAKRLTLSEEVRLTPYPEQAGDIAVGLGSPLLEKVVSEARASVPVAFVRVDTEAPRPTHVRSLAERFALRNGLAEIVQVTMGTGVYLAASVAYAIEADERREGLFDMVVGGDGGEPDSGLWALLTETLSDVRLVPGRPVALAAEAERCLVVRVERAVRAAAASVLQDIERRHKRDHERIVDYFEQLGAEARAPKRKTEPKAIEAKLAHLHTERDKKIEDLRARYAVRVTSGLATLVVAEVPCALVQMRLRRRKAERTITLRVPAGVHGADKVACEGCGLGTAKPAACDDAVHLLCEICAPSAQGRLACPACRS